MFSSDGNDVGPFRYSALASNLSSRPALSSAAPDSSNAFTL